MFINDLNSIYGAGEQGSQRHLSGAQSAYQGANRGGPGVVFRLVESRRRASRSLNDNLSASVFGLQTPFPMLFVHPLRVASSTSAEAPIEEATFHRIAR